MARAAPLTVKIGSGDAAFAEESMTMRTRASGTPLPTRSQTDVAGPFRVRPGGSYYLYHTGHEMAFLCIARTTWSHGRASASLCRRIPRSPGGL
jgi:hypothetical protein